jgi:hypothetical protein
MVSHLVCAVLVRKRLSPVALDSDYRKVAGNAVFVPTAQVFCVTRYCIDDSSSARGSARRRSQAPDSLCTFGLHKLRQAMVAERVLYFGRTVSANAGF